MVDVQGEIRYQASQLNPGVRDVYALQPEALGAAVANLVPAEDTFGAFLHPDAAAPPDRDDLRRDPRRRRPQALEREPAAYRTLRGHPRVLRGVRGQARRHLGRRRRASERRLRHDGVPGLLRSRPIGASRTPNWPAFALMVRLRQGVRPDGARRLPRGARSPCSAASPNVEKKTYRGLTYRRIRLEVQIADYATDEAGLHPRAEPLHLREQRDLLPEDPRHDGGPRCEHKPLSADPTFRETMSRLDERVAPDALPRPREALPRPAALGVPGRCRAASSGISAASGCATSARTRNEAVRYRKQLLSGLHARSTAARRTPAARAEIEERVDRALGHLAGPLPGVRRGVPPGAARRYRRLRAVRARHPGRAAPPVREVGPPPPAPSDARGGGRKSLSRRRPAPAPPPVLTARGRWLPLRPSSRRAGMAELADALG